MNANLPNEITCRQEKDQNMPPVWRVRYRGLVIWQRLSEPTAEEIRDALNAHRIKTSNVTVLAPLPKHGRYGRTPKRAPPDPDDDTPPRAA
jgi:hypothetical protein